MERALKLQNIFIIIITAKKMDNIYIFIIHKDIKTKKATADYSWRLILPYTNL